MKWRASYYEPSYVVQFVAIFDDSQTIRNGVVSICQNTDWKGWGVSKLANYESSYVHIETNRSEKLLRWWIAVSFSIRIDLWRFENSWNVVEGRFRIVVKSSKMDTDWKRDRRFERSRVDFKSGQEEPEKLWKFGVHNFTMLVGLEEELRYWFTISQST